MNVLLLGSCRIHRPLRQMAKENRVVLLNQDDPSWFLHTARAARQSLEIILGRIAPPLHLRDLIFETDDTRDIVFQAPDMVRQADIIVIEVCTITSIDVDGWEANAHRMWSAQRNDDPRAASAVRRTNTAEDIAKEINEIISLSKKSIMVVNHIAITGNPALDQARQRLTDILRDAQKLAPFILFDTGSVLHGIATQTALEDHNHYKASFERKLGEAMLAYMLGKSPDIQELGVTDT